ncbi:MAG: phosphohydrolase [Flavobacteriales bacterium]|nr:phosphohydrolase [Flavobacteriales bacterium]|tara:strand:+ start:3371 stop:4606 length:1236 start_codon:yes stop_codon:yes gene_type:complete
MSYLKNKIINDPIYGFIPIQFNIIWEIIAHPYFQRLRRISQLGLSSLVYPGAHHSRFHHAIGAMHLMNQAIQTLKSKGQKITKKEHEASLIAILLHDIGHGPFSHALEHSIVQNLSHEKISIMFMENLNRLFKGRLNLAIDIFQKKYKKKFLHQLISSQLDVDRLDYLNRDSFYSGVNEGIINSDRIISMMNVHNNELVIDYKGIYSIEKFIIARKLMYWQVYLHKTVLSAEHTLMKVLKRAKELSKQNQIIYTTPQFELFLSKKGKINHKFFETNNLLNHFSLLDDADILTCIKNWTQAKDKVLKILATTIINRKLLKIKSINKTEIKIQLNEIRSKAIKKLNISRTDVDYVVFPISIKNETYNFIEDEIKFLKKDNSLINLSKIKKGFSINTRNASIIKHYICYPEGCG